MQATKTSAAPMPCPAVFQDAYHYALAAAGDDSSSFYFSGPRNPAFDGKTRKEYLEMAAERLRSMGFEAKAPKTLKDASAFAQNIKGLARVCGINAYQGIRSCSVCGSCDHPGDDHDYYAREAARRVCR